MHSITEFLKVGAFGTEKSRIAVVHSVAQFDYA